MTDLPETPLWAPIAREGEVACGALLHISRYSVLHCCAAVGHSGPHRSWSEPGVLPTTWADPPAAEPADTETAHVRQPLRMAGRKMQQRLCSCGDPWPCAVATGEARWTALREHLEREAATHQELGDDRSEGADETRWRLAHEAWGAARAYREVIKYIDHELERANA